MNHLDIRKAASELRSVWVIGNEYLQVTAPWTAFKTNPEISAMNIRYAFDLIALFAELSKPFIPQNAQTISDIIPVDLSSVWTEKDFNFNLSTADMRFNMPDILFSKIDDADIETLKQRFGGEV